MSTYYNKARTNYFQVKNESLWENFLLEIGTSISSFGKDHLHGFCFENDTLWAEDQDGETDSGYAEELIQKMLPEGEACIITEIGWEKFRYLSGYATIITADDIRTVCLDQMALDKVREMLKDPDYQTQMDY